MADHAEACRVGFLGWQCRLRQWAIREEGGRPSPGMRPDIWLSGVSQSSGQLTVLINKSEAKPVLAQFQHIVLKTHDPENRYSGALLFLGEGRPPSSRTAHCLSRHCQPRNPTLQASA